MKISLLLPSYQRPELLELGLYSILKQQIDYDLEIIVINDGIKDDTEKVCNKYQQLNIKYIFSGYRNLITPKFRSPSFALNIGIKESKGEIIILSCPEIWHKNNSINYIVEPLLSNKKLLTTPKFISFDNTEKTTKHLKKYIGWPLLTIVDRYLESNTNRCKYATKLPFFMGMWKEEIVNIGGYDEDFSDGWACDDDDIVSRLLANGLSYYFTDANIIHLYHNKQYERGNRNHPKFLHNYKIFNERKNQIIRNQDREWGINKRG